MAAFGEFSSLGMTVEAQQLAPAAGFSPLLAQTRGLAGRLPPPGATAPAAAPAAGAAAAAHTLPDGRLHCSTALPLLAKRYHYLSTLGEGVSAQVMLAEDTLAAEPGGRLVAIKVMRRQHALAGQREARALRFLHAAAPGGAAPGVVRLLDTFSHGAHFCLVTERLYPWLLDWVAESSQLPATEALSALRKVAHQLLLAVAHMHNSGVVHSDIKPDNILLRSPPGATSVALRLVDFGNAFSLTETDHAAVACEVQTLPYRAPEAALGLPHGAAIDLWSVGVVLAEIALKRALLPCATPRDLLCQMVALLGPLPAGMVRCSALGQQLGVATLCAPRAGAAAAAAAGPAALPPELRQRVAAAAAAGGTLRLALPQHSAAGCQLHAELAAVDASLADLVLRLLRYDPARRITAHQALLHPFFDVLCPLRAAFPQLQDLCAAQEAALRAESAGAAGGAAAGGGDAGEPAAAGGRALRAAAQCGELTAAAVTAAAEAEAAAAEHAALAAAETKLSPAWRAAPVQQAPGPQLPPPTQSSKRQPRPRLGTLKQPFPTPLAALADPAAPPSRLPAAQLAARQWEEQRRLAAANPYSGGFEPRFAATPQRERQQVALAMQAQQQQADGGRGGIQEPLAARQDAEREEQAAHPQSEPAAAARPAGSSRDPRRWQQPPPQPAAADGDVDRLGRQRAGGPGATAAATARKAVPSGGGGQGGSAWRPRSARQQGEQQAEQQAQAFDMLLEAAAAEREVLHEGPQPKARPQKQQVPGSRKSRKAGAAEGGKAAAAPKSGKPASKPAPPANASPPLVRPPSVAGSTAVAAAGGKQGAAAPARHRSAVVASTDAPQPRPQPQPSPKAAAAAPGAGKTPKRRKQGGAGVDVQPGKAAPAAAAKAAPAGVAKTPGKRKNAGLGADAAGTVPPGSPAAAAAAAAPPAAHEEGPAPATAAKRQRRERGEKPWWVA